MERVSFREMTEHAARYLAGDSAVVVEQDGRPIGYYVPVRAQDAASGSASFEQLEQTVRRILSETGLTEDELSRLFDLSEPAT